MRTVLNLTLYIVLLIDLCGRGGDIARHPCHPDHMCLRWEDMAFYCFADDEGSIDICANVKVCRSKGQSLDESAYRIITFTGLLPTHLATQDTLRLLLVTALMDGVLSSSKIYTWEDLFKIKLASEVSKTRRRLPMNPEMPQIPVLRGIKNHQLTNNPVVMINVQCQIQCLGWYCSFENLL